MRSSRLNRNTVPQMMFLCDDMSLIHGTGNISHTVVTWNMENYLSKLFKLSHKKVQLSVSIYGHFKVDLQKLQKSVILSDYT